VLDFGSVAVGATSAPLMFLVKNSSTTQTHVVTVNWGTGGQGFAVTAPAQQFPIPPGGAVPVTLTFVPSAAGDFVDAALFLSVGPTAALQLAGASVKGKGVQGE